VTALVACLKAEGVKFRKSWMLLTALLAPVCQTGFLFLVFWLSESRIRLFKPGFQFWLELNHVAWNLVVLPIAAALICELSWEQEREARAWNRLLVQPLPRHTHFFTKIVMHLALVLLAQVLFELLLLLGGRLLQTKPDLLMGTLPLGLWVRFTGYTALASVAVVAFHTWLAMRIPGLWVNLGAALLGSWFTLRLVGGSVLFQFLPWGLTASMAIVFERWRVLPWAQVPGSLLLAGLLAVLGALDFTRHRETRS
jgi:hypothetical protein